PLLFHPAYNEVAHLPLAERCKALQEPQLRERIINEMPNDGGLFQKVILDNASHMFPVMSANIDYEPLPSASATAIAMNANKKVMEILLDQLVANDGHGLIYMPFFNYAYGDLSFNYEAHQHPGTRMGLSDAGAHCGAICDGGTPTFMLTHWVRDRTRGGKLPLEHVVHRQTQQTAALYGLTDRGHIAPGKRADINIIDFEKLNFTMPYMAYDLPAQGRRLVQQAIGYDATFVAGTQIVDSDLFTGALPGNLVRGPR
ncbi:MAG: D-aminoacylase, partial [Actinobacteria bacterium]|nr:D-aminoacylase [Actinomycetota bacterium]